ncbi:hypothetical protein HUA74_28425 [Myxococcus sp. CA051A]|uniref:hypothetical protein n=1 Tax=unclassified Myxococcus TaxID=2648731 RepID=UPI00157AE4CF|nr:MULTISPECIES: hypothetical protein [unclassified Myxococcus]NTX10116.1 hypothetical protein [Myxococcus sp. CA056]NTX64580.1 hypothetical protein [Myxococcus sp. CA051A]
MTRVSLSGGRWMLGLGAVLMAHLALADGNQCSMECTTKADATMRSCMDRCPSPSDDPTKPGPFQSCALRCQEKQDKKFNECAERCVDPEGLESPRKGKSGRVR